jgi:serine/threonine protein kinase
MADVHRAHDRLLGRDVAVKVLRDDLPPDTRGRERFVGEARLLAGLSHANLVTVLDAGFSGDRPYLVMELVEGRTLAEVVADSPLEPRAAAALGAQLADALAHAHAQGVVHRDVKPANVLVEAGRRVRLADFGIARLVDDATGHTRTGTAIGTAAYLAPEQVAGERATSAADVYSLGLVLLEALTGVRAFPGSTSEAGLARLHRSPDVPDAIPPDLHDLLTAMTAREPGDRPSAPEVARRLRAPARPPGEPDATALLTPPVRTDPVPGRGRAVGDHVRALADRVGGWFRGLSHQTQVVLAVVTALVVLLAIVAVVGGGRTDGGTGSRVPDDTPRNLRQPLQELHDAVDGS